MAIRNRRGLKKDLDPAKLLAGEFAFPTDTGEVYYCVAPGNVKRVATKEELQEILTSSPDAYQALLQLINNLEDNPSELTNILNNIANLQDNVGDLSLLATETKTNLVSAINEIMIGKFNISDLVHTDTISDAKKAPSSVVTEALGREIDEINNNLVAYRCTCVYSTANTQQNFFFKLPTILPNNLENIQVLATLAEPHTTANHKTTIFAIVTGGKLRVGVLSDVAQSYYINIMFVKHQGKLTLTT